MKTTTHRLRGSAFRREKSQTKKPLRVIFLSAEGKKTEPKYFEGLNKAIAKGELPFPRCIIKVLDKEDHNSDPGHVISLLEDYLKLRNNCYDGFPEDFLKKYNCDKVEKYFNGEMHAEEKNKFERIAKKFKIDVAGLKDLCIPKTDQDVFGIVIDHDHRTHLKEHIDYCREQGYNVFLTSPCFELWLLLHVVDVKEEYDLIEIFKNDRVSRQHNFVSKRLSELTGTNKHVRADL